MNYIFFDMPENDAKTFVRGDILKDTYRIIELLDEGGMGEVYKAVHKDLGSPVAVKRLKIEDDTYRDRFLLEAQIPANIKHRYICEVKDYGIANNGSPFLVMEYLEGRSLLSALADRKTLDIKRIVAIMCKVLTALQKLHDCRVVHRDMKPEHIYLVKEDDEEVVKIIDFGIAKIAEKVSASDTEGSFGRNFSKIVTEYGNNIGTPEYMAPEQAEGKPDFDHRVDIYTVGVILYQAFTGELPFKRTDGEQELLKRVIKGVFNTPSKISPNIPVDIEKIILKAMEKKVSKRYRSANKMKRALEKADLSLKTLENAPTAVSKPPPFSVPKHPDAPPPVVRPYFKVLGIVVVVGLTVAAFFILVSRQSAVEDQQPTPDRSAVVPEKHGKDSGVDSDKQTVPVNAEISQKSRDQRQQPEHETGRTVVIVIASHVLPLFGPESPQEIL